MSSELDFPTSLEPSGPASHGLLQVFWQRKWIVLLGLTLGLMVGALVYSRATPLYRSSAQVLVIKKRADTAQVGGGADPTAAFMEDYVSTHIALLKSPVVLKEAVKRGQLAELKTFEGHGNLTGALLGGLSVSRDTSSNNSIIQLSYQGPYPDETGKIIEEVIASYAAFLKGTYQEVSEETEKLIRQARDVLQKDLAKRETDYREFREKAPFLLKGKDGNSLVHARVAEIEGKRSALMVRKAELEGKMKAVQQAKQEGKLDVGLILSFAETPKELGGGRNDAKSAEEQLLPLLLEEEELLQDYGEDHPRVRSVRSKIQRTRKMLERGGIKAELESLPGAASGKQEELFRRYLQAVEQELSQLTLAGESLDKLLRVELEKAKSLDHLELADESHRNGIGRAQQLYDQTIKRLQEINLIRDFGGYQATTIMPPGHGVRVAPSLLRTMSVAAILGLLLGLGLGYLADATDRSFRSPEEIRRRLGLPIMGHIPNLARPEKKTSSTEGELTLAPTLCVHYDPTSIEAEAYRSLRTALYFGLHREGHKVIQVTSPNMSDGKTTLTANLALAIAQSGKRVIVVDADCRRPRIHKVFGLLPSAAGLTGVLLGELTLEDAVMETKVPNLFVLPCGTRPSNPAELLTLPQFDQVLSDLRANFDYVLVDTPPVLAVTDPCVVATRVDGIVLAIRITRNGRPGAERAKELLSNLGANVLGVVVNGIGREGQLYRHYAYDEYRYEYRSSEEEETKVHVNGK